MALTDLVRHQSGLLRPGDVVFDYSPWRKFPLHVGIYIGREQLVSNGQVLRVRGLPERSRADLLGDADWPALAGTPGRVQPRGSYRANILGHRKDVEKIYVSQVVLESSRQLLERSQVGPCEWDTHQIIDERRNLFIRGTCAQFVEFVYEVVGLDLIRQKELYNPDDPERLYPATQIHVFYRAAYGLQGDWDPRYERYPDCIFGTQSTS